MLVRTLIDQIAESLNDTLNVTWTRSFLLTVVNEGFCTAAKYRPDMFMSTKVVKLVAGTVQTACMCASIKKIIAQVDKFGNDIQNIPLNNRAVTSRWTGRPLPNYGEYRIKGYTFEKMNQKEFEVSPPVPANKDVWVRLLCASGPGKLEEEDETPDCGLDLAVIQWALYRALMVDNQDTTTSSAQIHYKACFELLQVQLTQHMKVQATPDTGAGEVK